MKFTSTSKAITALITLPTGLASAADKPVKVYILSGQSNMVGIGQVDGGGVRWGKEFTDTVVSIYEGTPDPAADYDRMKPVRTVAITSCGGTDPDPYPKDGVAVARGQVEMPVTGIYEFRPGYGASEECVMWVDGTEIHRKEPGKQAIRKAIKLEAGKKVPFKVTHRSTRRTTGPLSHRMCATDGRHQSKSGLASVHKSETSAGTRMPQHARNCCAARKNGTSFTINAVGAVMRNKESTLAPQTQAADHLFVRVRALRNPESP